MIHTQENISYNSNVVLTAFNEEYKGIRIFETAEYFTEGIYYDMCVKFFFSNGEITPFGATKPKGAIVITVKDIEKYE